MTTLLISLALSVAATQATEPDHCTELAESAYYEAGEDDAAWEDTEEACNQLGY